jgi:hypothetical protein
MELESSGSNESDQSRSGAEVGRDGCETPTTAESGSEFGDRESVALDGPSESEERIVQGVEAAERESHATDYWAAYYIAKALAAFTLPALREFAASGATDKQGLEQELLTISSSQTEQGRRLVDALAKYGLGKAYREQVVGWLENAAAKDPVDAQKVLQAKLMRPALEVRYGSQPGEQRSSMGKLSWFGLLRRNRRLGGWILQHQLRDGSREAFGTALAVERTERWQEVPQTYRRRPRRKRRNRRYGLLASLFMPIPDEFT